MEPDSPGNILLGNDVTDSGLDGSSLFRASGNRVIVGNVSNVNGFDNQVGRHGDGIILFNLDNENRVESNVTDGTRPTGFSCAAPCAPPPDQRTT